MKNIKETISSIADAVAHSQALFQDYIKDKNHPLDERWNIFVNAPEFLKRHKHFIEHFKSFEVFKHQHRNQLEDDLTINSDLQRGAVIRIIDWDEIFLDNYLGENEDDPDQMQWMADNNQAFTRAVYDNWREEVLAQNLGSIKFDW
jgi:hypothetical protein